MRKGQGPLRFVILTIASVMFLYGFSDQSIEDVETAIIGKDYEKARQTALYLLSQKLPAPQEDELRYYLGLSHLRLGDYLQASKVFSGLTKNKRNTQMRDKAFLGLFDVYYLEGSYKKASQTINRLLKVSPHSEFLSLIYLKAARAHLKLAQWENARQYLNKIITEYPDSLEVHVAKQLLKEEQYFAVQVGAFLDQARAQQLAHELQQKGEYAYIVETTDQENRTFYRVRIGRLVLLDKAQKLETKLSNDGYPTQIYP